MGANVQIEFRPQKGPQELFLSTPADVALYGGSAGGGKTWALLLEPLRHIANKKFGGVIFRKEQTQIMQEGGLFDEAMNIYPLHGATQVKAPKPKFTFPSGARIGFDLISDLASKQGAQYAFVGFDELTHFSKQEFFYILSRLRSTSGVKPYVRATCNPDADSWVAGFIAWWINQETGLPIPERGGVVRYFAIVNELVVWADSKEEMLDVHGRELCKSFTFVPATVHDNRKLLDIDPNYLANLEALPLVDRERLLGGNWKIKPAAGMYFRRHEARVIDQIKDPVRKWVRSWDLAATEADAIQTSKAKNKDPDWTVGLLYAELYNGRTVVADVKRFRKRGAEVETTIISTAGEDPPGTVVTIPQDPGAAGKAQAERIAQLLRAYNVKIIQISKDKVSRAGPVSSQWQLGNVSVVKAGWNDAFFSELEQFPDGAHDDQVDPLSDAHSICAKPAYTGATAPVEQPQISYVQGY